VALLENIDLDTTIFVLSTGWCTGVKELDIIQILQVDE